MSKIDRDRIREVLIADLWLNALGLLVVMMFGLLNCEDDDRTPDRAEQSP